MRAAMRIPHDGRMVQPMIRCYLSARIAPPTTPNFASLIPPCHRSNNFVAGASVLSSSATLRGYGLGASRRDRAPFGISGRSLSSMAALASGRQDWMMGLAIARRPRAQRFLVDRNQRKMFATKVRPGDAASDKDIGSDHCNIAADDAPSSAKRAQSSYSVARIGSCGELEYTTLQIPEILRNSSSIHVRDLFSLALTSRHEAVQSGSCGRVAALRRTVPAVILPRGSEIIISFGNVRAVIGRDYGMLFDAHKPDVMLIAQKMAATFSGKMEEALNSDEGDNIYLDEKYKVKANYTGDPFELVFIEEVLRDCCNTFNRRIRVYEPIVDSLLNRVSNEVFSESGVHRLVPVKDSLQEFEMNVKQGLDCITHLLSNDEDMLGLLLTQKALAHKKGETLHHQLHESVELMLEEYARQLNGMLQEIHYLLQRVQSKQELVAISLDAYRNRMIRMNVYLSIAGIGLAVSTTVAGFYGMNLINGLEDHPTAFNSVVLTTSIAGILIFTGCTSYLSGARMQRRAVARLDEIETISGALSDMASLDYVIKEMITGGKPMDKEEFKEKLMECREDGSIDEQQVDLLFSVLDISKDGWLYLQDFRSIESFGPSPRTHYEPPSDCVKTETVKKST